MCVIVTSPFFLLVSETYILATIAAAFVVVGLQCKAVSSPILSSVKVVVAASAVRVHKAALFNFPCMTLRDHSRASLRNNPVLAVEAVMPGNSLIS